MKIKQATCLFCCENFSYNIYAQKGKYCSNKCQQKHGKEKRIATWLETGKSPGKRTLREYLENKRDGQCYCCGITDWNGKFLRLEIDHIDGNPYNDSEDNLRLLCPNCHSQTDTYKNKNKGKGRLTRREKAKQDYHRRALVA